MEELLQYIGSSNQIDNSVLDIVFQCMDYLELLLADIDNGNRFTTDISPILEKIAYIVPNKVFKDNSQRSNSVFRISEYDEKVIDDAIKRKENVYLVIIEFMPNSIMKGARSLLIINQLKEMGHIIRTHPDQIEKALDNDISNGFSLILITSESRQAIIDCLDYIDEIQNITIHVIEEDFKTNNPYIETSKHLSTRFLFRQNERREIVVAIEQIDKIVRLLFELTDNRQELEQIYSSLLTAHSADGNMDKLENVIQQMKKCHQRLEEVLMDIRICTVENVFSRFPRLVRELTRRSGKKVDFTMEGNTIKMDKAIIEKIVDPIIHLLRNAVDHGIEPVSEREQKGKNLTGHIQLSVEKNNDHIVISVKDDGRGINIDKVRKAALSRGMVTEQALSQLNDKDTLQMIFKPGFSTADVISEISGRGIGMDVVKTNVERLGGTVEIETAENQGTKISMIIPAKYCLSLEK